MPIKGNILINRGNDHTESKASEETRKKTTVASTGPEREPAQRIRSSRTAHTQTTMESQSHSHNVPSSNLQCPITLGSDESCPNDITCSHTPPHNPSCVHCLPGNLNMALKKYSSP